MSFGMSKFSSNLEYFGCCISKTVPVKLILGHLQDVEKVEWLEKKYSTAIPSFFLTQQKTKK
jgi:hypothetical protein